MGRIGGSSVARWGWHDNGTLGLLSRWKLTAHRWYRVSSSWHITLIKVPPNLPSAHAALPVCWILPGSELNRRGLSNQTTHAKGNGEENDGVMGVCCLTVNALLGGQEGGLWFWMRGFFVQYVLCENLWDPGAEKKSVLEQEIDTY